MINVLVILGATATGKSAVAIECAKKLNGEIISADSMQIYKRLNVGTAKIQTETTPIKHHLIDICEITENYSVVDFVRDAKQKIYEISSRKMLPIICGGTGLYLKSLIENYDFGNTDENLEIRKKYENLEKQNGANFVWNLLNEKNSQMASQIHPNKTRAVIKALQNIEQGIDPKKTEKKEFNFICFGINFDREIIYNRINDRVDKMIQEGLLEEVKYLMSFHKYESFQCSCAIGYKEFFAYYNNVENLENCTNLLKQHTRNYAKRQITWFKKMPYINWLNGGKTELITTQICDTFKKEINGK